MRLGARMFLVAFLVAALIDLPVLGAPAKPLGVVVQAQHAQLDDVAAVSGATVYASDSLATDTGGSLRVSVGAAQLYLLSSSSATLNEVSSAVSATLAKGTAGFSTSGGSAIEVRTPHAVIRAKTPQLTHGRVTITGPNELMVTSFRGPLEVDADGEVYSIAEGRTYRVISEEVAQDKADPQDTQGSAPKAAWHRHTAIILVALVAIQVGATLGIIEAFESPTKPKH